MRNNEIFECATDVESAHVEFSNILNALSLIRDCFPVDTYDDQQTELNAALIHFRRIPYIDSTFFVVLEALRNAIADLDKVVDALYALSSRQVSEEQKQP